MEEKLYYSPEEEYENRILESLINAVNTYSEIYNNPQYGAEEVLKGIETSPDKINALIASINSIGIKKELDLDEAKRRYEGYKSDDFNIESYIAKCVEGNDRDSLLSFLGAEVLRLSEFYQKHQKIKAENSEYSLNITAYNDIYAEWNRLCKEYGDPPLEVANEWEMRKNAICEKIEGTPFGQMMDNGIYSDTSNTLKGLEQLGNIEQLQDAQLPDSQLQNGEQQLQTTPHEGGLQILLAKGSAALQYMKDLFNGNKGFGGEVMNKAEEQLGNILQEMNLTGVQLGSDMEEFLSKIGGLGENALEGLEQFGEKGLDGLVSNLKANILGGQDLGELSQTFLEAKESGDTEQMAKLSGQIVRIATEQEPQRYKDMTAAEMYNYRLAEGLAAYDVEEYKQVLSSRGLKISNSILKAMQIAKRENYCQDDFYANEQLVNDIFSEIENKLPNSPTKADALRAFRYALYETKTKEEAVKKGEHSNLELYGTFASISKEMDKQKKEEKEIYAWNALTEITFCKDEVECNISGPYRHECENGDNVPETPIGY